MFSFVLGNEIVPIAKYSGSYCIINHVPYVCNVCGAIFNF